MTLYTERYLMACGVPWGSSVVGLLGGGFVTLPSWVMDRVNTTAAVRRE